MASEMKKRAMCLIMSCLLLAGTPSLDLLAMAAENKQLKEKLTEQVIANDHLMRKLGECQKNTKSPEAPVRSS